MSLWKKVWRSVRAAGRLLFAGKLAGVFWPVAALILALLLVGRGAGWTLRSPVDFGSDAESAPPNPPRPAEFLYLDKRRALAYLAQLDGGTKTSEQISQRLKQTLSGELITEVLKAGATKEQEDLSQSSVTPTGASSFIELLAALHSFGELREVSSSCLSDPRRGGCPLKEGQLVRIRTEAIQAPLYADPYLAVEGARLTAIFPALGATASKVGAIEEERTSAHQFAEQVGQDPRMIFELAAAGRDRAGPRYLLPVRFDQLTEERSLIKSGGGEFTIVGKVVRVFPEATRRRETVAERLARPAYVDSLTREFWRGPLEGAEGHLICRSEPRCLRAVHLAHSGAVREAAVTRARERMLKALGEETTIGEDGAVIIPIAIYK